MTARKTPSKATGDSGEDIAANHLARLGFRTLARNWRPEGAARNLELDLVGRWEGCLVFTEVKTRRARSGGGFETVPALASFTPAKRRNLTRAARAFLAANGMWDVPCRIDLVCVTLLPGQEPVVDLYRDVTDPGHSLDSGDAHWQP